MARLRIKKILLLILFMMVSSTFINAQITSQEFDFFDKISSDTAYIFCTTKDKPSVGILTATSSFEGSVFAWEKFDTLSNIFIPFSGVVENAVDSMQSTIRGLDDGLYRVTITSGGNIIPTDQAYIFNNWIDIATPVIPDSSSTCKGFQILASFEAAPLRYFDQKTNTIKSLRNPNSPFDIKWTKGSEADPIRFELSPYIFPPIASKDPIKYQLTITDRYGDPYGCKSPSNQGSVQYNSKVPKSAFEYDPKEGEAVLKVTFKNEQAINYDSILWFFYKDNNVIKREAEKNKDEVVDSIDFILVGNSPVHEYEWAGEYKVKVVTVKVNPTTGNCYDTLYMKSGDFIQVDTALVEVPNVFTPNGDGANDEFVVKTRSLKSMTIHIYNRWGGLVHSWSYSNIRSRDYTYEYSIWDGKIGGRMASPGVYFYVITVVRRDDKPTKPKQGFVHLFRNKN